MIGSLKCEEASARSLMERVLRDGGSLAAEYPLIFDNGPGRVLSISVEGAARTACSVLPRDFRVGGLHLRGGLIGSVTTDPDWRRRGLASRLLVEAEAALQLEGCAFACLWADDPGFYLNQGWAPIGSEEDFLVTADLVGRFPTGTGIRSFDPDQERDVEDIQSLYGNHPVGIVRTVDETRSLLRCPEMRVLVVEREKQVVAYAAMGRGLDFSGTVHEWGGKTHDVLALIQALLIEREAEGAEGIAVVAPSCSVDLRDRLMTLGAIHHRGILGLGKLLDRRAACEALNRRLEPFGSIRVVDDDPKLRFHLRGPSKETRLDDDAALALLLGAEEVRPSVRSFLAELGLAEARLPFEPFAWGLDSI